MAITDGDILSALSELKVDTSKISQSLSTMSERDLHQIQQDLNTLVRLSQGTQRSAESGRFQRERDDRARARQAQSQGSVKSSFSAFKSSRVRSSSYDGIVDEFLDNIGKGLEDELKKSFADSPISRQIKGYLKKFADDLGIEVSQIPSALGQELGKQLLKNTQLGQGFTSVIQNIQNSIFNSVSNAVKRGASRYAQRTGRNSYQDVYTDFVESFRRNRGASSSSNAAAAARSTASNFVGNAVSSAAGSAEGNVVATNVMRRAMGAAVPLLPAGGSSAVPLLAAGESAAPLATALPQLAVAALAATVVIDKLSESFGPATEGIKKFTDSAKKVSNRYYESQKQLIKEEQDRIKADIEVMVKLPFDIMTEAAQKWYDAWDNNLKKIGQVQGYTKADVQTLFESYATRLRSEGLGNVISAADISTNLGQVIGSGLAGKVAEEFAYQATLLGNAIPNQDFFSYADTYGQIVGNAVAKGMSQDAALKEANKQLQQHASNLLYAGRNISDGMVSALKDGSSLFADAVKIANTARTGESTRISAVLTAAAAEVSAIAPDLASDLISNIVQAAVGGNNSDLVALRSLAGIGASNTAFIQALAQNPQQVFTALFSNLANMQNLDRNNYMEVAESLSQTFGISASALARIDFRALAQAISDMQVNNAALSENMKLLKSGQTTPTAEAMRMQKINEMMLDEGLAYVLDNEAARAIQQHMWDQERANEMMEHMYSVDFAGSAKEMIQGIFETVHNIINFLNPFSWIGNIVNLAATGQEYGTQLVDLQTILAASKVGSGNLNSLYALSNYNGAIMNNVPSLLNMLGFLSSYDAAHANLSAFNTFWDGTLYGRSQQELQASGLLSSGVLNSLITKQSDIDSKYRWGFVSKSLANAIAATPMGTGASFANIATTSNTAIQQKQVDTMNQLLASMNDAISTDEDKRMSYDTWRAQAMKTYKIKDFGTALSEVGLTEAEVRSQFESKEAQQAARYEHDRDVQEDEFWKQAITYYTDTFPIQFMAPQLAKMDEQIQLQSDILSQLEAFYQDWDVKWLQQAWSNDWLNDAWKTQWLETQWSGKWIENAWNTKWISNAWKTQWLEKSWKSWYKDSWTDSFLLAWRDKYVEYTTYTKATRDAYDAITRVKNEDKKKQSGDAVLALAKALTSNKADLKDPQVQTNALLSQILIVIEAILQAENTSGGASLATSLSALGLGLTT